MGIFVGVPPPNSARPDYLQKHRYVMNGEPRGARAPNPGSAKSGPPDEPASIGPVTRRALRVRAAIAEGRYQRDPKAVAEAFVIREYFDLDVSP